MNQTFQHKNVGKIKYNSPPLQLKPIQLMSQVR